MFFLQFLNLDVLALHPFVLEANADVVDGQDGMSAVRTPHVGVEEDFHECPCLIRVDLMLDLVSSDCLCCHSIQSLFGWFEIIRYLLCGLLRLDELSSDHSVTTCNRKSHSSSS